jgi:phosphoribosylanthranilate isomerase
MLCVCPLHGSTLAMRIKVCCIQSIDEAELAIRNGAHALGMVSQMLFGTRAISNHIIREITEFVPPTYSTVLLTSEIDPNAIVEHQRATRANTLQLVGSIDRNGIHQLRERLPGISLIKVVHVEDSGSVEAATRFFDTADALLLDTKVKARDGEALGGTGVTHDWSISRQIVELSPVPVFLAGGLSPENVGEAIQAVRPFGVDVCSSLRPNGSLDSDRLREFVSGASGAAA